MYSCRAGWKWSLVLLAVLSAAWATADSRQWLPIERWGNGSDGALEVTGSQTENVTDGPCSGTIETNILYATGSGFASNQIILIHQSRGAGAGNWELNVISSVSADHLNTKYPLTNTYQQDGGANRAQVRVVRQYSSVRVYSGVTWSCKAWNGSVGGLFVFMCSGTATVEGTISGTKAGFRGGFGCYFNVDWQYGYYGEGIGGDSAHPNTNAAFYNAGGAGYGGSGSGAGGGNGTVGVGNGASDCGNMGYGGNQSGDLVLLTATFGGGGSSNGTHSQNRISTENSTSGVGGGFLLFFCRTLTVNALTGIVTAAGGRGADGTYVNVGCSGGGCGGGAGGSILIKCDTTSFGSDHITALGGGGGTHQYDGLDGGAGGDGRIAVYYGTSCSGSTQPAANVIPDSNLPDPTATPTNSPTVTVTSTNTPTVTITPTATDSNNYYVESHTGGKNFASYSEQGTWREGTSKSSASGMTVGIGSRNTSTNNAGMTVRFALPAVAPAGVYEVYLTWVAGSNRATTVPYRIDHDLDQLTGTVNQQSNSNAWTQLGIDPVQLSPGRYVELATTGAVPVATAYSVVADGVWFHRVGSVQSETKTPTFTATVTPTASITPTASDTPTITPTSQFTMTPTPSPVSDFYVESRSTGKNYAAYNDAGGWLDTNSKSTAEGVTTTAGSRYITMASSGATARFRLPSSALPGQYEIYLTWKSSGNRVDVLPVLVDYDTGTLTNYFSQRVDGNVWSQVGAGSVQLSPGRYVEIDTTNAQPTGASSYVMSDAAWFHRVSDTVEETKTPTMTVTPTFTVTPTSTDTPTLTVTPTDTFTVTPTDTPTATPTDTATDTPTITDTPTDTPTGLPTATPSDTPTAAPTDTPTDTPSSTPITVPTDTPSSTPSLSPTPAATGNDLGVDRHLWRELP